MGRCQIFFYYFKSYTRFDYEDVKGVKMFFLGIIRWLFRQLYLLYLNFCVDLLSFVFRIFLLWVLNEEFEEVKGWGVYI